MRQDARKPKGRTSYQLNKLNTVATKRMFSNQIVDTDKFRDLPISSRCLYYDLGMDADDEGIASFKKAEKLGGYQIDDLRILQAKNFVHVFDSGVVVIIDFNVNNWLDSRRVKPTVYQKERRQLELNKAKSYVLSNGLADAKQMLRESRIEENRIDQESTQTNTDSLEVKNGEEKDEIKYKLINQNQEKRPWYK